MTDIAAYIAGTRIGHRDQDFSMVKGRYSLLVALCRNLFKDVESVPVAIVYTISKASELVTFSSGQVLVFDQYVGQALNTLTRILYWSKDQRTARRYFAKLLAEESVLVGNDMLAGVGYGTFANLDPF